MVDSSMFDNMIALNEAQIALYSVAKQVNTRGTPKNAWPRDAYKCSDGWVAINVPDNIIWARMTETIGHPSLKDDERAKDGVARCKNRDFLNQLMKPWFKSLRRDEVVNILNKAGVPCGPVYKVPDIFDDPHVNARGVLIDIEDPDVGAFKFARTGPHLGASPEIPANPAPELGQHSREILENILGYSCREIDNLTAKGIVQL